MSEKTVFSYFNSIKQKTLQKLVNDIIDSTHNNNSQKLLYLLSQAIQINLSSFSLSQIELIAIAIVKLIEANYDKRDIQQFLKFLCKMLKHLKNNNTFKISLDWKLFYKIFFISSSFFSFCFSISGVTGYILLTSKGMGSLHLKSIFI